MKKQTISLEHLYDTPDQSMEMAEVVSSKISTMIPKNVSDRIYAGNPALVDVFYNDHEDTKHSVFCAFDATRDDVTFTFGFVRAGTTKGQKGFNGPDPKFEFRVLLVKVGAYHERGKLYLGTDFDDNEFESIWSKLDPIETPNVSASNWRNQDKLGSLTKKLQLTQDNLFIISVLREIVQARG
jgi:hypothetical protein